MSSLDVEVCARSFEEVRAGLAQRLRGRRAEIEDSIFARVRKVVSDPAGLDDPAYLAGLRAAVAAAVDFGLIGIEQGEECAAAVPAVALEQARRAARVGVGLDTVLRRYVAGLALLEDFVMLEAEHGDFVGERTMLREVLNSSALVLDRLIPSITSAYNEQLVQLGAAPAAVEEEPAAGAWDARPQRTGSEPADARSDTARRALITGRPRERILRAMVEVAAEHGFAGASVKLVTSRAGVSSRTFYEQFEDLRDCFVAVLDLPLERAGGLVAQAFARESCWQDGVLGALASLLAFFDADPLLTRVWFVESLASGPWALERREHIVGLLRSMIVGHWVARADEPPEMRVAAGTMSSVLGLIQTHLLNEEPEPLIELLGPLMGLVTALYLDEDDVGREVARGARLAREIEAGDPRWSPPPAQTQPGEADDIAIPSVIGNPSARRARECLFFLAGHPGSSNREVAVGIGVTHQSQISRLLAYLVEEDLVSKHSEGAGKCNAWRLTTRGEEVARVLPERPF